jgi:pyruvate kinase
MSFVRSQEDIKQIKKLMINRNRYVPVIAKIEKREALDNIDEILNAVDGIMVARGDLAVETAMEKVPLVQKMLIKKCNQAGKPVITATQMLKSMVDSPRPSRAEASDVANAVLDGTAAVMLSEETAVGKYPIKAVQIMTKIIEATELNSGIKSQLPLLNDGEKKTITYAITSAVSRASYEMTMDLKAKAILTPTISGATARMIARYRPWQPIIALCPDPYVVRHLNLIWGVYPVLVERYVSIEKIIEHAKNAALKTDFVKRGDIVVITAGVSTGIPGTTNLIKAEVL